MRGGKNRSFFSFRENGTGRLLVSSPRLFLTCHETLRYLNVGNVPGLGSPHDLRQRRRRPGESNTWRYVWGCTSGRGGGFGPTFFTTQNTCFPVVSEMLERVKRSCHRQRRFVTEGVTCVTYTHTHVRELAEGGEGNAGRATVHTQFARVHSRQLTEISFFSSPSIRFFQQLLSSSPFTDALDAYVCHKNGVTERGHDDFGPLEGDKNAITTTILSPFFSFLS